MNELFKYEYTLMRKIDSEEYQFMSQLSDQEYGAARLLDEYGYIVIGKYDKDIIGGITPSGFHAMRAFEHMSGLERSVKRRYIITTIIAVIALILSFVAILLELNDRGIVSLPYSSRNSFGGATSPSGAFGSQPGAAGAFVVDESLRCVKCAQIDSVCSTQAPPP